MAHVVDRRWCTWTVAALGWWMLQGMYHERVSVSSTFSYRAGRVLRGATCGGEKAGDIRFEVGGKFAQRKITATYKAGALINTKVHIDINHWGALVLL